MGQHDDTVVQREDTMEQCGGIIDHSVDAMVLFVSTIEQWDETMEQCDVTI